MTFGERILNARVKQNLTVHEVAAQLSISETTLRRYELDQLVNPRYELVVACSRVLSIPLSSLMGWHSDNVEADIPVLCRNKGRLRYVGFNGCGDLYQRLWGSRNLL